MAQIVTITNPLTGQPAQVDQLDHTAQQIDDAIARALPGGAIDITLQNKLGGIESTEYPGCYYRMVSGVVEWFNPPMYAGEEYRTTERYQGKPVYAQLFSVGACSAGSSVNLYKRVGELNTDKIASYCGYAADCALPYFVEDTTYNIMLAVQKVKDVFDLAINVTTGTSTSFTECYVTVKYTKTTD